MDISSICYCDGDIVRYRTEAAQYFQQDIVTCSSKLAERIAILDNIADSDVRVLISGEPGIEKEKYAERIHKNSSRSSRPMMRYDFVTNQITSIEKDLLGYSADANPTPGLYELAENSTLLLNGLNLLPSFLYKRLYDVFEQDSVTEDGKKLNVRIISTNSDNFSIVAAQNAEARRLYNFLSTVQVELPPLRERPEDIALLSLFYLNNAAKEYGIRRKMGKTLFDAILKKPWYGNERELRDSINSLIFFSNESLLNNPAHLDLIDTRKQKYDPQRDPHDDIRGDLQTAPHSGQSLKEQVREFELALIRQTIKECGSLRKAAKVLQVNPSVLSRKLSADNEPSV